MAPQLCGVFLDEIGAQQIPAFARSCLPQLIAIEPIAERGAVCGDLDRDQTPGGSGLIARAPSFMSSSSRESATVASCLSRAHSRFSCRRRIARSLATRSRLWART